jgi:four helix bundle protein
MRDHTKLKAFELSHKLVLDVYRCTNHFPDSERFGLTNQLRRASVSISSNIVEGCARQSKNDYLRFLTMSYGSAKEVEYQLTLAFELNFIPKNEFEIVKEKSSEVCRVLNGLINSLKAKNRN